MIDLSLTLWHPGCSDPAHHCSFDFAAACNHLTMVDSTASPKTTTTSDLQEKQASSEEKEEVKEESNDSKKDDDAAVPPKVENSTSMAPTRRSHRTPKPPVKLSSPLSSSSRTAATRQKKNNKNNNKNASSTTKASSARMVVVPTFIRNLDAFVREAVMQAPHCVSWTADGSAFFLKSSPILQPLLRAYFARTYTLIFGPCHDVHTYVL